MVVHLAMLLKHSCIVRGCIEILADDGVNAIPQVLVVRIGPVGVGTCCDMHGGMSTNKQ